MEKENKWHFIYDLPEGHIYKLESASKTQIEVFQKNANKYGVQENVIKELVDLYKVVNELEFEVILGFHSCDDEIIFEWWNEGVLWLGQRDFNTLRWVDNTFCLGDAGQFSYSKDNEYSTLVGLVKGCIKEIDELNKE